MSSNELTIQESNVIDTPIKRSRNALDKAVIRKEIAECRMQDKSFKVVAEKVGLSERQVRRHYKVFMLESSKKYQKRQQEIFGEIAAQFEMSLAQANKQLAQAIEDGNPAKIYLWQKLKQESLRDYHRFLIKLNFDLSWTYPQARHQADYSSLLLNR